MTRRVTRGPVEEQWPPDRFPTIAHYRRMRYTTRMTKTRSTPNGDPQTLSLRVRETLRAAGHDLTSEVLVTTYEATSAHPTRVVVEPIYRTRKYDRGMFTREMENIIANLEAAGFEVDHAGFSTWKAAWVVISG